MWSYFKVISFKVIHNRSEDKPVSVLRVCDRLLCGALVSHVGCCLSVLPMHLPLEKSLYAYLFFHKLKEVERREREREKSE